MNRLLRNAESHNLINSVGKLLCTLLVVALLINANTLYAQTDNSLTPSVRSPHYNESSSSKPWPGANAEPPSAPYIRNFSMPFNEYTWVAAHNAYLNDTSTELERGARSLMWDLHPLTKKINGSLTTDAYMCHARPPSEEPEPNEPCSDLGVTKRKFSTELNKVKNFLDKAENRNAVVTIFLEDRIDTEYIQKAFNEVPNLSNYIFNINDYANTNQWPTLQQIIDSNRRIIIFFERENGKYLFSGNNIELPNDKIFIKQNIYNLGKLGVIKENWACNSRYDDGEYEEGKTYFNYLYKTIHKTGFQEWPRLFTMNQYHSIFSSRPHAAQVDNNLTWLEFRVDEACKYSNAGVRMVPNYIALDFTQLGDAIPYAGALTEGGVYFYEKNGGKSEAHPDALLNDDVVCVLPTSVEWDLRLKAAGCENDETRSLALRGVAKGISIKLFDKPDSSKSDDWTEIEVLRDIALTERVIVGTFEKSYSDANVKVTNHSHNGLDGKVSHITIEPVTGSVMPKLSLGDQEGDIFCNVPVDAALSFELQSGSDHWGCQNDQAATAVLSNALAGTTITLFGTKNSDEKCSQGCLRIFVRKDMTSPFDIGNIQEFGQSKESPDGSAIAYRFGGSQALDGKVSYMTVNMNTFGGQDVIPTSAEADGGRGAWGNKASCPSPTVAWGFDLRNEEEQGQNGDNSGLNSLRMYCSSNNGTTTTQIISHDGYWGTRSKLYKCSPANGPLKGFALKKLWPRAHRDEVEATEVLGVCQDNTLIGGDLGYWGSWSKNFICPAGENVVGFINRVESKQSDGDDTAMNGLRMYCAKSLINALPVTPLVRQLSPSTALLYWEEPAGQSGIAEFRVYVDGKPLLATHENFTEFNTTGIKQISVIAVDFDNNVSPPQSITIPPYETAPPAPPTGLKMTNLQGGLFEVSWDKTSVPTSELIYEASGNSMVSKIPTEHSMVIADTTPPENFTFSIRAHKFNDTYSEPAKLYIDRTPPTTPTSLAFSDLQPTSLTLTWTASKDDVAMKDYAIYKDEVYIQSTEKTTDSIQNLEPGENHTFSIRARDAADNESTPISIWVDREPPKPVENLEYKKVTDTSLTLQWSSTTDNVAVTGYTIKRDDNKKFDSKTPNYDDTTLTPLTTYRYEVMGYDANGNLSTPAKLLVDRIPPSAPLNPQSSNDTGTTLQLNWDASSDDIGVTGYNVYIDKIPEAVATSATPEVVVERLAPVTTYTFYIEAIDAAGNKSPKTPILVDRVPPTTPAFFYAHDETSTFPTLNWTAASDDIAVKGYELVVNNNHDEKMEFPSNRFTARLEGMDPTAEHAFSLRAFDAAGNYSSPIEFNLQPERPNQPFGLKGTVISNSGIIFDWARGPDNRAVKYAVKTNTGINEEITSTQITVGGNGKPITIQVQAIDKDGVKSLSVVRSMNPN